ncbi:hypothetical protein BKA66DRAFT_218572 [Pyrenochaeta sp. MPI-SDFR-AT-0127]|nr:hypothetical protein BKA66DRAFT_218572 [Pyrenochaeta sp. MPI-SDFR-AT-0127]
MAVTANGTTQSQETRSPDSVQLYSRYLSKRCPEVYKVDKIYVGRLKEVPPPSPVQGKWDKEVRPDLERHLCQATNMMSKSMPDEEVITEPVLCMAGKKCSPMSVPLKSGATCPKDPVALNPTIWIYCGGRKCKKQVSKSIRNLTYLHHFLNRFGMGAPHISLYAPWPAVREHSPGSPHHSHLNPASNVSFAIQQLLPGQETICGAKARFTIETSGENVECNSTIGGLVVVDDSIFAITSAHAIVNRLLENSHSVSSDETESLGNVSTDEDSEHEMSSSSDSSASGNNLCSHTTRTAFIESPPSGSTGLGSVEEGMWINTDLPSKLAYMTHGTINGDYSFPDQAPSASDFALVDVGPARLLLNGYYDPDRDTLATISDHIPVRELSQGDVWILTNCDAHGMSGSWVVHEGSLCGVVYAAYDRSPYVHMLPADTMFQNIIELLQASVVRVANAQDIRERKVQMELRTLNLEGKVPTVHMIISATFDRLTSLKARIERRMSSRKLT